MNLSTPLPADGMRERLNTYIAELLSQLSAKEAEIERLMALCNETIAALAVARACLEKDGRFVATMNALNEALDDFRRRAAEALRLSREGK
jgi:hypothetical protein